MTTLSEYVNEYVEYCEYRKRLKTEYQLRCSIRDITVIELLFATGMRISELCSLKPSDIDLTSNNIVLSIWRTGQNINQFSCY